MEQKSFCAHSFSKTFEKPVPRSPVKGAAGLLYGMAHFSISILHIQGPFKEHKGQG